jgi:hypothetical protein
MTTAEVWKRHIHAWDRKSVEDIVEDYALDSRVIVNSRSYIGRQQIAGLFEDLFEIFSKGENRIDTPIIHDRFVYISWRFSPENEGEVFGTDTFVVEDGKIVLQTIGSSLYDK